MVPRMGIGQNQVSDQTALDWREGDVPVSTRFDDPYFSLHDGLAETRHVFLAGNDLPARFADGFRVAELGFGTGLNLLATLIAWTEAGCPGTLHYTSFEAFPLDAAQIDRALRAFPEAHAVAGTVPRRLGARRSGDFALGPVAVEIIEGDARETLPAVAGSGRCLVSGRVLARQEPRTCGPTT